MRKHVFGFISAIVLLALTISGCNLTKTQPEKPKPTDRFFVNDFADVISASDEDIIYSLGVQLQEKTKAQVVALTVDSLGGKDIRQYGVELARDWEIGEKDKNTGVLLLVSVKDRKISIEVGYGLEGGLTDLETKVIIDQYAKPWLSQNDYSTGIREAYKALINEVYIEFGIQPETGYTPAENIKSNNQEKNNKTGFSVLPMIVLALILLGAFSRRGRRGGMPFIFFGGHGGSGGFGGFNGGGGGFSGGGGSFGGGGSSSNF